MQVFLETSGYAEVRTALQQIDPTFQKVVESNFVSLGNKAVSTLQRVLRAVRFTGALEQSVVAEFKPKELELRVYPKAPHAIFTRTGTRPHWAPIEPLKRWAAIKLGDEKLAYAVQRNIAKFGTSRYLSLKGIPYNEITEYGIGFNFPKAALSQGDLQSSIKGTAQRIGTDLVAMLDRHNEGAF